MIDGKKVTWTGDIPFCQHIPCFPPPAIPHGSHSGIYMDEFYYGSAVTYTCEDGYPLVGEAHIHCTSRDGLNGEWSGRAYCGVTECSLPKIENGRIVVGVSDTYKYNQSVTLDCNNGHKISGSREIHCQVDGTWDPPLPHCERVAGCIAPEIQNGRIISTQVVHKLKETITFECDPGYILKGNQTIQCQIDNTWDSPVPICIKGGSCGPAPWLKFAELLDEYKNNNSFPVGSTVRYVCHPGYVKHPGLKASHTCLINQQWSEFQEFCKRKSCGFPGEPENGRLIVSEDFLFGSTVNYTCEDGYRLVGESSRQCAISGWKVAWTGDTPLCESISCLPPPVIPHGKHSGAFLDHFYYGTVVIYTCEDGYTLVGDTYISCTSKDGLKGEWSGRAYCSVTYCLPPPIENGRIVVGYSATYTYGQSVTLDCNAGYEISGSKTSNCQVDGTWDPPLPHCERVLHCPFPPDIANGKHNKLAGEMFTSHVSVTYSCDPGYLLIGNASISCTSSGTWSFPLPRCEVIECPLPPKVQHGKYNALWSARYTIGKSVRYSCEPGYVLIGEATIHCTAFGVWSLPVPRCEAIGCLTPKVKNGRVTSSQVVVKSTGTITFECDPGYILKGNHTIQCKSDSTWGSPVPFCDREIQCQSPCSVPHGSYIAPEGVAFTSGMSVKYTCDPGYTLTGEATISCTGAGTWSAPAPHCQALGCPRPPGIINGMYIGEDFTYRNSVIYICDVGYSLIGNHMVTCSLQGSNSVNWTEPPICKGCPAPSVMANGKHDITTTEDLPYGSSMTFHCDPGYILIGEATIHCLSSGIWHQPVPQCKRKHGQTTGCVNPEIQNGRITRAKVDNEHTETITIECNPGYILKGNHTIQCNPDSTWDSPVPICVRKIHCQSPPLVLNGFYSNQEAAVFTSGMFVKYMCDPGYTLTGEATIYCTDMGTWSSPAPQCKVVKCHPPPYVQNATHSSQETTVFTSGMSIKYKCEPGYTLIGEATVHCTTSGTWSPTAPSCGVMHCPPPPSIAHGKYIGKDFTYGKSVIYFCDAGHSLIGERVITCSLEGSHSVNWTEPPKCKGEQAQKQHPEAEAHMLNGHGNVNNPGSYSATVIAFGSAGGVLLLIISGGIWVLVSRRNKVNRKIYRSPDIQVQEPSII